MSSKIKLAWQAMEQQSYGDVPAFFGRNGGNSSTLLC